MPEAVMAAGGTPSSVSTSTLAEVKEQIEAAILRNLRLSMTIASVGGILVFGGLSLLPNQSPAQRMARITSALVLVATSLIALGINKRWGARASAAFFASMASLVAFGSAYSVGLGVMSSGATIPAAWIVVMGFVIGPTAGVLATRLAIAGVMVLLGAQWFGLIPGLHAGNAQPAGSYGVVLIMIFLLIGSTITQYSKLFWNAMHAVENARNELQAKVDMQQKTQQDLIDSKQRLATLLDHAPMAVLIFDKDTGRLHYANQNALNAHGASRLQDLPQQCMYPDAPYRSADMIGHIHATRDHGVQHFQWRSRTVQGQNIWWAFKLDMLTIDDQAYVVSFGHDITTRLQAEQALLDHRAHLEEQVRDRTAEVLVQKHRLEAVIEALPVSLTIKDMQGRFQLSNRLFEEACAIDKSALLGHTAHGLFSPALAAQLTECEPDLLGGAAMVRYENAHERRDGSRRDYLVTKVALHNTQGQPEGILTLAVDISDQKNMQRELAAAKNEAEHLASVKSAFLANMSHEIRTPLHGMLGMSQLGQNMADIPAPAQHAFARITQSGRHLLGVINDILDFSKMDAGKLTMDHSPLDPRQVAEDAVAMVTERAQSKGLPLRLQCGPTPAAVMGDPLRTRQILINLLSNAVKFTEHGHVTLSLSVHEGQLHYAIEDTGIGMHPDSQARVFSPFEQADGSTSRRFGGTGLGLSISQQLAKLMGGDIHLRSALAEGSTFTLRLPLEPADAVPAAADTPLSRLPPKLVDASQHLAGLRVLAADDVGINRDILSGLLSPYGVQVHCCENGKQTIELLRKQGPGYFDIVLMDVQMPVMNGLQATQLLHMIEPDLPVVALTAHAMAEECERCTEAGMVGHLAKPFDTADMMALIVQHARRRPHTPDALAPRDLPQASAAQPESPKAHTVHAAQATVAAIDFDAALRRCGGQAPLLHKLMARFGAEQANFVARCQQALGSDADQARRMAHTLKGTAGNLGMAELAQQAGALEDALRAGEARQAQLYLGALSVVMAQHLAALGDWLAETATA
jgi:PAS domain S-box-containing protein